MEPNEEYAYCGYCDTKKRISELYKADACADGMYSGQCCWVYKCLDDCVYKCCECGIEMSYDTALLHDESNKTENRKFVCSDCFSINPLNKCECGSKRAYAKIGDGKLKCPDCDQILILKKIKIWYGISKREYERRYL